MDWTATGALPPIFTGPTVICLVFLRTMSILFFKLSLRAITPLA
jgi:hypothetical protein